MQMTNHETPLVFNVQRFSLHDGPGIRTTAFFKGCPLRCAWCHNPESQSYDAEEIFRPERCTSCGRCAEGCAQGAREVAGQAYAVDALTKLLLRDRQVFETSGGGVTLSGGEPLSQDGAYIQRLVKALKRRGVHVCVDTCGCAPWSQIEPLIEDVDLWLYDFKALDAGIHAQFTGLTNELILANMKRLCTSGSAVWLRVPVIPGVNDQDMRPMAEWAAENLVALQVNLLPYHKLGQGKLPGATYFTPPTPEQMDQIMRIWLSAGFSNVKIGG